jgi:hypothetical protein
MNEKILIKKKIDSAALYIPELENYMGKTVRLTISISSEDEHKMVSSLLLQSEGVGLTGIDMNNITSYEGECSFEIT